jgi:hypothetical protein
MKIKKRLSNEKSLLHEINSKLKKWEKILDFLKLAQSEMPSLHTFKNKYQQHEKNSKFEGKK